MDKTTRFQTTKQHCAACRIPLRRGESFLCEKCHAGNRFHEALREFFRGMRR